MERVVRILQTLVASRLAGTLHDADKQGARSAVVGGAL